MRHIFDGIRVLDLSQVLAGPTITRFLAEMGADVIKVELPPVGDSSRALPHIDPATGRSAYYVQQNRGKRSVCIDLKQDEGKDLLRTMIAEADVFVESFSPGAVERLGFGWDDVRAINDRLVMVSVSAFGRQGPLASKPGYDNLAQAYSGIMSMIGEPGEPPPIVNAAIGDVMTGVHGFGAVSAALFHRERTGEGQYVEVSLLDSYFGCHEINVQAHSLSGGAVEPTRSGSHHFTVSPFGVYSVPAGPAGDGSDDAGEVVVCLVSPDQWGRLCGLIERPELADDPRFVDNGARTAHKEEVIALLQGWFSTRAGVADAIAALESARIPCAPVLSVAQAAAEPHLRERGTIRTVSDRWLGDFDVPGFPLRFGAFPGFLDLEAPYLGEHNAEVLTELAGLDETGFRRLADASVVAHEVLPDQDASFE